MTFSTKIKKEICANIPKSDIKAFSEIAGILLTVSLFKFDNDKIGFNISTDNKTLIEYSEKLFFRYFNGEFKFNLDKKKDCFLEVNWEEIVEFLENTVIFKLKDYFVNVNGNFDNEVDAKSFIKGVFIGCGSISNPEKRYHLEFVISNLDFGNYFRNFLNYYGLNSKIIKRKNYYVVYIKEADNICKILSMMGAYNGVLEFENIRVDKEYSNNKNRLKNCIEANEDKLIIASVRQVRAIMVIDKKIGLDKLPKNLREIAEVRLKNKEMSLKDLGMILIPPLGKSGVLHRLKKIEEIAESLGD